MVGIVADSRLNALDQEIYPQVFWPMAQLPASSGWIAVRTSADPASLANTVQKAIRDLDPELAVSQGMTMQEVLADSAWRQRLTAVLLGVFAGLAAVLAGAGIYGVFSYLVTRRIKELGVRIALGATRIQILGLVIGSALRLALIGIAIGTVAALAAGRLVAAWLYGIQSHDLPTIGGVCLMLLIVAAFACYVSSDPHRSNYSPPGAIDDFSGSSFWPTATAQCTALPSTHPNSQITTHVR